MRAFRMQRNGLRPQTPMELAARIGQADNRRPGALWNQELQVGNSLLSLRRSSCDDRIEMRIVRHVGLIGPNGAGKTSTLLKFVKNLSGALPYENAPPGALTYFMVDGGAVSWEGCRGGVVDGNLVMPILHDLGYLVAGDLTTFLGSSSDSMRKKIEVLNPALEQPRTVVIKQLAIGNVKPTKRAAFANACREAGAKVRFDEERGIISYEASFAFAFASWPYSVLDKKVERFLTECGFRSRSVEATWLPSDEEHNSHALDPHGDPDLESERRLLEYNRYAWACSFTEIKSPPLEMIRTVLSNYHEHYRRISRETTVPISDFSSLRDFGDAMQIIVAFAAMRTIWAAKQLGWPPNVFPTLEYLDEDVRAAIHFRAEHLAHIEQVVTSKAKEDKGRDVAFRNLISFLERRLPERDERDRDTMIEPLPTVDLVKHIVDTTKVSRQAAYQQVAKMRSCGYINLNVRDRLNLVGDLPLVEVGLKTNAERAAEAEKTGQPGQSSDDGGHEADVAEEVAQQRMVELQQATDKSFG